MAPLIFCALVTIQYIKSPRCIARYVKHDFARSPRSDPCPVPLSLAKLKSNPRQGSPRMRFHVYFHHRRSDPRTLPLKPELLHGGDISSHLILQPIYACVADAAARLIQKRDVVLPVYHFSVGFRKAGCKMDASPAFDRLWRPALLSTFWWRGWGLTGLTGSCMQAMCLIVLLDGWRDGEALVGAWKGKREFG